MKYKINSSRIRRLCVALLSVSVCVCICGWAHAADDAPAIDLITHESSIGNAEIRALPSTLKASPDGKHIAFIARRDNAWLVVMDGVFGKEYDAIGESSLVFSPDSKRIAYAAMKGNDWIVVVDGMEGAAFDGLRDLVFSPNSRRVAYAANRGRNWSVVVDGTAGREYDECREIVFSPDSTRTAYAANRGRKWLVVLDGTEGKEYDFNCSIVFSPDSKRLAYAAKHGNNWSVVLDGAESKECDAIGRSSYIDPDNLRKAYAPLRVDPQNVVVDDIVWTNGPTFSPDSRRLAYWIRRGDRWRIAVDGVETKEYDGFIGGSNLVFDSAAAFHAIAVQGNEALRVNIEVIEKK